MFTNKLKKAKKTLQGIILLLAAPLLFGAVTTPQQQPQWNGASETTQNISLSSKDLGLSGALSLDMNYSKNLGTSVISRYTRSLGTKNALSLGLEAGKNQYRAGITWGHAINLYQRIKATAEYLAQNLKFNFYSGSDKEWIGQYAYGLEYQYLFPKHMLTDIDLKSSYSKAESKTLPTIDYTDTDGINYRNFRHIAGGTEKSLSLGFDLHPFMNTLLGIAANYDSLKYDMLYEHSQDTKGLGATITLHQLLTKKVKLELLASSRKPYQDYKASIYWLLNTRPGSELEFGLMSERIIGANSLANDTIFNMSLGYKLYNKMLGHQSYYSFAGGDNKNSLGDLTAWTATPAVYMPQVLAIKDEKREVIVPHHNDKHETVLYFSPGENIDIAVSQFFKNTAKANAVYQLTGLPQPPLKYTHGEILGKFIEQDLGKSYDIEIHPETSNLKTATAVTEDYILILDITRNQNTPYPTENKMEDPLYFRTNHNNIKEYNALWLFADGDAYQDSLKITATSKPSLPKDINWSFQRDDVYESKSKITFSGNPKQEGEYKITLKARNLWNPPGDWSKETRQFTLRVIDHAVPTVTIHPKLPPYWKVNNSIDYKIADITAGKDETLKTVVFNKDIFKEYGLILEEKNKTASTEEVWIKGMVTKITPSEQSVTITATNSANLSAHEDFKLNLGSCSAPTITVHEPNPHWKINENINAKIADITAGEDETLNKVEYSPYVFQDYGLELYLKNGGPSSVEIWAGGKTTKQTPTPPPKTTFKATNMQNLSAQANFNLYIDGQSTAPTVTIHPEPTGENGVWIIGQNINYKIADISAGTGSTLSNVELNKDAYKDYGLTLDEKNKTTVTDEIWVHGTPIKESPAQLINAEIKATNNHSLSADGTFGLNVESNYYYVTPDDGHNIKCSPTGSFRVELTITPSGKQFTYVPYPSQNITLKADQPHKCPTDGKYRFRDAQTGSYGNDDLYIDYFSAPMAEGLISVKPYPGMKFVNHFDPPGFCLAIEHPETCKMRYPRNR